MAPHALETNKPEPPAIPPSSEVLSIGWMIGGVLATVIVIIMLIANYVTIHRLRVHARRRESSTIGPDQPALHFTNRIDEFVLSLFFRFKCWILGIFGKVRTSQNDNQNPGVEEAWTNSVLYVSDLQIALALSILVGGFAQLPQGITCYDWQNMVNLAWFPTVTQFSCVDLLSHRLYSQSKQRALRLCAMAVSVALLLVATVPTGNFDWSTEDSARRMEEPVLDHFQFLKTPDTDGKSYAIMIISTTLLLYGFIMRVIKLYKVLYVNFFGRIRSTISKKAWGWLRKLCHSCGDSGPSPKRLLLYRTLLSLLLTGRVFSDICTSMLFELWWVITSFIWGVRKLADIPMLRERIDTSWSFGQVMPLALLGLALAKLSGWLYGNRNRPPTDYFSTSPGTAELPSPAATDGHQVAQSALSTDQDCDRPDQNYYNHAAWFKAVVFFIFGGIFSNTAAVLVHCDAENELLYFIMPKKQIHRWFPLYFTTGPMLFLLYSLLIEDVRSGLRRHKKMQRAVTVSMRVIIWVIFSFLIGPYNFPPGDPTAYEWTYASSPIFYILLCFIVIIGNRWCRPTACS